MSNTILRVCFVLCLAGCRTSPRAGGQADSDGPRGIHELIESKLDDQRQEADGFQRLRRYTADEYQTTADILQARRGLRYERRRMEQAQALMRGGPLLLEECLAFSLDFNDQVQAKRAGIRAVGGNEIINRSRFIPRLVYGVSSRAMHREGSGAGNGSNSEEGTFHSLRLSQRLFEFGKDNQEDVALRESQREALFDYEDTVRSALSGVRRRFFTIILRQQQLAERQKSLAAFRARYEQMKELEKTRRVVEVDVLTARLNVLNEEVRINSLEQEILRQKIDLLHLLGFPVGMTEFNVEGEIEELGVPLEAAVRIALRRSSLIGQFRAEMAEQERALREVRWQYAPDVRLRAGWKDDENTTGVSMDTTDSVYGVGAFAEAHSGTFADRFDVDTAPADEDDRGWFMGLSVELPLFEGRRRRGEYVKQRARLDQARHELHEAADSVDSAVRKTYQTVLERRKQVEILSETVTISKERLRVQERLKELGEISDNELETFRRAYFSDQDGFFAQQINLMNAQEDLRSVINQFEPLPAEE